MDEKDLLAERFEANRSLLRGVAFRMLGCLTEADDALQEAWIRLSRTDTSRADNLRAFLTTLVRRLCLNMLRARKTRREASLQTHLPAPILSPAQASDPEQEALLADSVGLALLLVLACLTPAERLAFVLHDVFAVPFDEIAALVGRTATAARQLASRAGRRVQSAPVPDVALDGQWAIVEAFLAAAREGDFFGLLAVLDVEVVLGSDGGVARPGLSTLARGAHSVAERAMAFRHLSGTPNGSTQEGARQMSDRIGRAAGAPRWVTFFGPIAKFLLAAGVPMGPNALVTIRGRKSGLPRTTPVAIIEVSGRRWVWAPWGEVAWVRNLRAAGRATIIVHRRKEEVPATELDPTRCVAFFRDILGPLARGIPVGVWFVRTFDQVDLDDPMEAAEGRCVFELHPLR